MGMRLWNDMQGQACAEGIETQPESGVDVAFPLPRQLIHQLNETMHGHCIRIEVVMGNALRQGARAVDAPSLLLSTGASWSSGPRKVIYRPHFDRAICADTLLHTKARVKEHLRKFGL